MVEDGYFSYKNFYFLIKVFMQKQDKTQEPLKTDWLNRNLDSVHKAANLF